MATTSNANAPQPRATSGAPLSPTSNSTASGTARVTSPQELASREESFRTESGGNTVGSLEQEALLARQAFANTLFGLKHSLQTAADPRAWAQRHPWVTAGAAVATGYVAAKVLTGSGKPTAVASSAPPPAAAIAAAPASGPKWTSLLFDLARVLLTTQLVPMIKAWQESAANASAEKPAAATTAAPDSATPSGHNGRETADR